MNPPTYSSDGSVLLVGGGAVQRAALARAVARGVPVVAADGGAAAAIAAGRAPDAVYGDMDSLPASARDAIPADRLHRIAEQDSTDFDKALRHIAAPLVLAHGFLGARLDHQLAALATLAAHPHRRCILIGGQDVAVLVPPVLDLALAPDTRVSLFPLGPVRASATGLRWPVEDLELAPDGRIGTSNAALGPVTVRVAAPKLLLILPVACQGLLEQALAAAAECWPAPA